MPTSRRPCGICTIAPREEDARLVAEAFRTAEDDVVA